MNTEIVNLRRLSRILTLIVGSLFCWAAANPSNAQTLKGQQEFGLSTGFVSPDQELNFLYGYSPNSVTMSSPSFFANYKYFIYDKIALGLTGGQQTLWGTKVDENADRYNYKSSQSTIAAEMTIILIDKKKYQWYQMLGMGMYYFKETDQYNYSPPFTWYGNFVTTQCTFMGFRFGGKIAGFAELGLGYKGLFNGGLSWKLDTRRPRIPEFSKADAPSQSIVILPDGYSSNGLEYLGKVKSGNPAFDYDSTNWDWQLNKVALNVKKKHGNVFKVSKIKDPAPSQLYNIKGAAYYAEDLPKLRKDVQASLNAAMQLDKYGYVIVYRPRYIPNFLGFSRLKYAINDSINLKISKDYKYIFRCDRESTFRMAAKKYGDAFSLKVKPGEIYYLTPLPEKSGPNNRKKFGAHYDLKLVDKTQGALESSLIQNVIIKDMAGNQ